ncbi:hypothetical protein [Brevibacterium gallinarum]|uniref:Uncharacterized protein n=1 Tax=Brevibacterium gallinarum TaxID=2762220 RepID=A0ABR8WTS7_9MICO|nr:hypothetical protein [Brevibacterium gallinarum]MBD8020476.1 hypothetical protein [Brevibacterium gallinarum]
MIPDVLDAALECGRRQKVGRYESCVETNRISHGEWRRFFFIQTQAARWNWNSFANCTANGLGVKAAQEIVKAFAEPKVRKALKSKQYKKASSIAFNILKKTSPKIASFIIKRAANAALPGGVVTFFSIPVGKCAVKELFNRRE